MPTAVLNRTENRFQPVPLLRHYCTSLLNRVEDFCWERRLGVQTTGGAATSRFRDAHHYGTLAYHTYFSVFDHLGLAPSDVVVDLGAGKGRVTCIAALYPVRHVFGVEIDPELCALGRQNGDRMRMRRAPVTYLGQSATEYRFEGVTVVTMFNPFGSDTMHHVLVRLRESLAENPRQVRIVYGNPVLSQMLAARTWLELEECWEPAAWSRLKFPVHFYRTRMIASQKASPSQRESTAPGAA